MGAGKERVGAGFDAVCHAVARSLVKYSLRCVCVLCIWCAVSGKLYALHDTCFFVLPCRVAAEYATPTVRPPKGNPKCMCLPSVAKRCIDGQEKQNGQCFFELLVKPLCNIKRPFGAGGILYSCMASPSLGPPPPSTTSSHRAWAQGACQKRAAHRAALLCDSALQAALIAFCFLEPHGAPVTRTPEPLLDKTCPSSVQMVSFRSRPTGKSSPQLQRAPRVSRRSNGPF